MTPFIAFILFLFWWAVASIATFLIVNNKKQKALDHMITAAEKEASEIIRKSEEIARTVRQEIEESKTELRERKQEITQSEEKLREKDARLEAKLEDLDKKQNTLREKSDALDGKIRTIDEKEATITTRLEEVAHLSQEDAKELLLETAEQRYEKDILAVIEKKRQEYRIREKEMAREVIIKSIQQYAGDVTGEMTQTMVKLENDDVKGKLIGKEGRNIIAFEKATGVSLIIDDTPDNVFISSFDLFRRYIAKKSLEELIEDKRIQPARIEEIVEKNQAEADTLIYDLGTKTLNEMGISGIPDEIIPLIGKFRFRTSYGQNILMHSKEVAYIAESIAKLIGADASLALKGGLLHDLGKAMDHDVEGTHPEIGGRIARKYGLDERIVNIIEGHHDDVPQICLETKIIQIADAISAIRPGARRMNAEEYIKRIQEMENLAMSFSGVNKAYALSAGREVRIFVDADTVSDIDAMKMAQEIAGTIETNLSYPGEIKVNLIREKRVIEYAR
mgnify:CR=1 FL=1